MWEDRRLRHITEVDLRQIIDAGLEGHLQLEYKSALYDANDRGSRESLFDICMFANAGGGILLLGISEQRDAGGQPTGLPDPNAQLGLEIPNPEAVLQAYDARVVANIQERLPLESSALPLADNRHVLAIRVPNSMLKPHRVHYQGHTYFPSLTGASALRNGCPRDQRNGDANSQPSRRSARMYSRAAFKGWCDKQPSPIFSSASYQCFARTSWSMCKNPKSLRQ